jgi:hypothetical protein
MDACQDWIYKTLSGVLYWICHMPMRADADDKSVDVYAGQRCEDGIEEYAQGVVHAVGVGGEGAVGC